MGYKPKVYKKFIAPAATATMIASALQATENNMNWDDAKEILYAARKAYEEIGPDRSFGLSMVINPLIERFSNGERTEKLYNEINSLCLFVRIVGRN